MIPKSVDIKPPLNDQKAVQLERLFSVLFANALQGRSGSYTGDGTTGRVLFVGIKALFIVVMRKGYGNYNACFAIREADGYAYIPGVGIVQDAVTAFGMDSITLGGNVAVNAAGVTYAYFAIG